MPYLIFRFYQSTDNLKEMENEGFTSKKNTFVLPYADASLKLSGDFDSGNLYSAALDLEKQELCLTFGKDKQVKPSSKTWFYFSIQTPVAVQGLKLYFLKVNTLTTASKVFDLYRPVVQVEGQQWERHILPIDFETSPEGDVNFKMTIDLPAKRKTYIALCYPWSVGQNECYLQNLQQAMMLRKDIYFNKEVIIHSPQKRPLHLISISSIDALKYPPQKYLEHLFPCRENQNHFREIHKPMILITARVHPGEVGSSHALRGMIEFIVSNDQQAVRLRNQFYFMIIPMLNPDGVFNGNNRMDSLGQNLNRFYHLPDLILQPSCYAVKSLIENTRKELFAYFDLHGHANKKSCFLFGNYISNQRLQVESILFAKHLSSICEHIQFKSCNFSKKQMSSRDKNQDMSKEGCARVVVHRWTNSPYCYTLETGLFKNVKVDEKGIFRFGEKFYNEETYKEVGVKMLVSFSSILKKSKAIEEMRKFCLDYAIRLDKMTIKKDKVKLEKVPKSLKSLKSQDTESEESSKRLIQGKQNQRGIFHSENPLQRERVKQVMMALHKNKGQLMNMNEDDDDQE